MRPLSVLQVLGELNFAAYDEAACERVACPPQTRMFLLRPQVAIDAGAACPVDAILADAARSACEQTPAVPAALLATCDYG